MTKGFKKDGKFRPTEKRMKSALTKSHLRKKESMMQVKDNRVIRGSPLYEAYLIKFPDSHIAGDVKRFGRGGHGHFGTALLEGDIEEAMYRADAENLVKLGELGIENLLSNERKHPDDPSPKETFQSRLAWAKDYVKSDEFGSRNKKSLDEPVLEMARLEDILEPVGDAETGEIHFSKLEKAVEENVKEILERENLPINVSIHFQEAKEETGEKEFKRTGKGESGSYQYMFNIYNDPRKRVEDISYRGVAYGTIQAGEMIDMELDVFNN